MAPLKYVACQAEQLLILPVKHRFVLATHWVVSNKTPTINGSNGDYHHRPASPPPRFRITENEQDDLGGLRIRSHVSPSVMLWNYIEGRQIAKLEDVAPGGIRSISCDGRLAVDGFLQVYDLETGKIRAELGDDTDEEREFTFVRLTHDGLYLIWVDKVSVKAKRVSDGTLIAHISTHERPTSLCVLDYGYILVLGREDGRLLIMRLLVDRDQTGGQFIYRPNTASDRTQMLLDRDTCDDEALNRIDLTFLVAPHDVKDSDLTKASEHVKSVLVHRAKVPLLKTGHLLRSQDASEKYCRSLSHLPPGLINDFREGSPITTHGGCPSTCSPMIRLHPLAHVTADEMERSGSTPCLESSETPSDGENILLDITPPASASVESPLEFNSDAGMLYDKRSASESNMTMLLTLPTSRKKGENKHGTFSNTPRNRGPLSGYAEQSTPCNSRSGLPPTPATRRRFLGALFDWGATLRAKRKKSKQRAPIDVDCRDRMPSV